MHFLFSEGHTLKSYMLNFETKANYLIIFKRRTALHLACALGRDDIVKFLLANNAKTNLCDNYGRTPLMKVNYHLYW